MIELPNDLQVEEETADNIDIPSKQFFSSYVPPIGNYECLR